MIDATTWAARWAAGVEGASEKVAAGVNSTNKDPIQLAITAAATWQRNVSSAAALNNYKSGLGRSNKAKWQKAMTDKGIPNMGVGARAKQDEMPAIMSPVLAYAASTQAAIQSMAKGKGANNEARMLAWSRRMGQYRKQ